jgi:hypothetical protein
MAVPNHLAKLDATNEIVKIDGIVKINRIVEAEEVPLKLKFYENIKWPWA